MLNSTRAANLVHAMAFTQLVKLGVHGVQHADDLHRRYLATDWRKTDYVTEQDRHVVKHLYWWKINTLSQLEVIAESFNHGHHQY